MNRILPIGAVVVAAMLLIKAIAPRTADDAPAGSSNLQSVTGVFDRIRQDVGVYELQAAHRRGDLAPPQDDPALVVPAYDEPPSEAHPQGQHHDKGMITNPTCPIENYDFDVTGVTVSLNAVSSMTQGDTSGLTIPFAGVTIGPEMKSSGSRASTRTVTLVRKVPYDPAKLSEFENSDAFKNLGVRHKEFMSTHPDAGASAALPIFPITETLSALRANLIAAALQPPCFEIDAAGAPEDVVVLDFQVKKSEDATVGFTISVISAKTESAGERDADNTIRVSFAPHVRPAPHP